MSPQVTRQEASRSWIARVLKWMFGAVSSGRIVRNILEYLGVQGQETLAPAEYLGGQGQESETRAPTTTTRTADDKGHGPPKVSYKVVVDGELHEFYAPRKRLEAVIVFVHGLVPLGGPGFAWRYTWTSEMVNEYGEVVKRDKAWPHEWLSQDLPGTRMLSFSYDSAALLGDAQGRWTLAEVGRTLASVLQLADVGRETPVVFVVHSLGGLVVKQACIELHQKAMEARDSESQVRARASAILKNIKGVVFYGTPHLGSRLADWLGMAAGGKLVPVLRTDSEEAKELHAKFMALCETHGWRTLAFCEKHATKIAGSLSIQVVSEESASHDMQHAEPIPADHVQVCKPANKRARQYMRCMLAILEWTRTQPAAM